MYTFIEYTDLFVPGMHKKLVSSGFIIVKVTPEEKVQVLCDENKKPLYSETINGIKDLEWKYRNITNDNETGTIRIRESIFVG